MLTLTPSRPSVGSGGVRVIWRSAPFAPATGSYSTTKISPLPSLASVSAGPSVMMLSAFEMKAMRHPVAVAGGHDEMDGFSLKTSRPSGLPAMGTFAVVVSWRKVPASAPALR
jgi:hypothetical protein